jgi:toxin ParE1/3/4
VIKRRPRAIYAIINLAEYIGQDSPASAERFMDATEETFKQLEEMPGLGHRHESPDPRLAGVRVWSVRGFPNHLIFYKPFERGIEVLHLLHGARDVDTALARELRKGPL